MSGRFSQKATLPSRTPLNRTWLKATTLFIAFTLHVLPVAHAEEHSAWEQSWAESGMSFQVVEAQFTNDYCYAQEARFAGCAAAAQSFFSAIGSMPALPGLWALEIPAVPSPSAQSRITELKKNWETARGALFESYRVSEASGERVDFEAIWSWVRYEHSSFAMQAGLAGQAFNSYLFLAKGPYFELMPQKTAKAAAAYTPSTPSTSNVSGKLLVDEDARKVGYLKISSLIGKETCLDALRWVEELTRDGAEALVLDLTGNGGGHIQVAGCVANLFLDRGQAFFSAQNYELESDVTSFEIKGAARTTLPMVTLIDQGTKSFAEILAASLKDNGRSLLDGEASFGKDILQTQVPSERLDEETLHALSLVMLKPTYRMLPPSRKTYGETGVLPHLDWSPQQAVSNQDERWAYSQRLAVQSLLKPQMKLNHVVAQIPQDPRSLLVSTH